MPNAQREPRRFSGVGSTLLFGIFVSDATTRHPQAATSTVA
jgi:hypothetical protein